MTFKQKILSHYTQHLEEKIKTLRKQITDLTEDAQNDAKGSAGDKHETALSMMHLEQEKLNQKIKEALEQKNILDSIDSAKENKMVAVGSLVYTNTFVFFVSSALPQATFDEIKVVPLSLESPIGSAMKGKQADEEFAFNTSKCKILKIE